MKSVVLDYRRQSRWSIRYIVENNNKIIKYRFLLKSLCISLNLKTQYSIHKGKYRLASWLTLKPTLTQRHHPSSLAHSSGFSSQPRNVGSKRRCTCWERVTFRQKKLCFAPYFWSLCLASSICPLTSYYTLKHKQTCRFTWLEKPNKTPLNLYSLSLSLRKYSWCQKLLW